MLNCHSSIFRKGPGIYSLQALGSFIQGIVVRGLHLHFYYFLGRIFSSWGCSRGSNRVQMNTSVGCFTSCGMKITLCHNFNHWQTQCFSSLKQCGNIMTRIYWPVTKADGPVQCTMQRASSRASAWHAHFRMQNQNCYTVERKGSRDASSVPSSCSGKFSF